MFRLIVVSRLSRLVFPIALWFVSRHIGAYLAAGTTLYGTAITVGPLLVAGLLIFVYGSIGHILPALAAVLAVCSGILGIHMEIARWTAGGGTYSTLDVLQYLDWPLVLVSCTCFMLPVYLFSRAMGLGWRPQMTAKPSKLFGSSRWMTFAEAGQELNGGELIIGEAYDAARTAKLAGRAPLFTTKGDGHLLTVGGAGSGKTTTIVIPNCLTWAGSLVTLDPKGELNRLCRNSRTAMGHQVVVLNPDDQNGDGIDVLGWINPRDHRMISDIDLVVSWIIEGVTDASANKAFEEQAKSLLAIVIISTLIDSDLTSSERTLATVFRRLGGDQISMTLAQIADELPAFPFDIIGPIAKGFLDQKNDAAETWQGVMLYVQASLTFLRSPGNLRLLSGKGTRPFPFNDLLAGTLDVFIAVPLRVLDTSPAVARLIVGSLVSAVMRRYEETGLRPQTDVLFLLDEMPRLRKMAILETARDAGRGYGIRLWGIVQDFGQLKQWYGDNGLVSWLANSRIQTFIGISDPETAEWLSQRMGTRTGLANNWGTQSGRNRWDVTTGNAGGNSGQNETSVALMTPGDIMQMATDSNGVPNEQIVVMRNKPPLRCGVANYLRRPEMMAAISVV